MDAAGFLERLLSERFYTDQIAQVVALPERPARYGEVPGGLAPAVQLALEKQGIAQLYEHQAEAIGRLRQGESIVIVTGTASGKTLCYNIPVVETLLEDPLATALFIYPDQGAGAGPAARAGQVPASRWTGIELPRRDLRRRHARRRCGASCATAANVILTNPDMLHQGILPQHARWNRFFTHLKYVVIDEVHAYRGVFGSHLANVMRRLRRICAHYGVDAAVHLLLGHHRQPAGARRAHRRAADGAGRQRRLAARAEAVRAVEPAAARDRGRGATRRDWRVGGDRRSPLWEARAPDDHARARRACRPSPSCARGWRRS